MEEHSETNYGWWIDKPDRAQRGALYRGERPHIYRPRHARVWECAALVVAVMVAFGWSLKSLAGF